MKKLTAQDLLPTDKEVQEWYELNIGEDISSVSSSIFKFRLFMKDYIKAKLEPEKHNVGGFTYTEKKQL